MKHTSQDVNTIRSLILFEHFVLRYCPLFGTYIVVAIRTVVFSEIINCFVFVPKLKV